MASSDGNKTRCSTERHADRHIVHNVTELNSTLQRRFKAFDETFLEDQRTHMETTNKIFQEGDWLTADEIDHLQKSQLTVQSLASDWRRDGRVFSVPYEGRDYYARYQFDSLYQPLPVIKDILDAYGPYVDAWSVAAWFHFPNGWITEEASDGVVPVSPKDVLHRGSELINAARNRRGTYVA